MSRSEGKLLWWLERNYEIFTRTSEKIRLTNFDKSLKDGKIF